MQRITVEVSEETYSKLNDLAKETKSSKFRLGGTLIEEALSNRSGKKNTRDELLVEVKKIQAKLESSNRCTEEMLEAQASVLGCIAWFLPAFCEVTDKNNNFINYFSELTSAKMLTTLRKLGENLLKYDWLMPLAVRDLPEEVDLDTRKFANGITRKRWEEICTQQAEKLLEEQKNA